MIDKLYKYSHSLPFCYVYLSPMLIYCVNNRKKLYEKKFKIWIELFSYALLSQLSVYSIAYQTFSLNVTIVNTMFSCFIHLFVQFIFVSFSLFFCSTFVILHCKYSCCSETKMFLLIFIEIIRKYILHCKMKISSTLTWCYSLLALFYFLKTWNKQV